MLAHLVQYNNMRSKTGPYISKSFFKESKLHVEESSSVMFYNGLFKLVQYVQIFETRELVMKVKKSEILACWPCPSQEAEAFE